MWLGEERGNFWSYRDSSLVQVPAAQSTRTSNGFLLDRLYSWTLMYSWTQALLGLAQKYWPCLVTKLWRRQKYYIENE